MMIPARVVVVILMRELATIGATLDAARGIRVIHVNFLGYDEQAHRRGPESRFAHWTLRGIDAAIRRLWIAVHRSARRQYDVWVYSDHGQESTTPYESVSGSTIQAADAEIVEGCCGDAAAIDFDTNAAGRARWLGTSRIVAALFGDDIFENQNRRSGVQVQAVGPLGLVYIARPCSLEQRIDIAEKLVREKHVPMAVLAASNQSAAIAVTSNGRYQLPDDAVKVFGSRHPFSHEVARDLVELCHHVDAGDLVISGWSQKGAVCFARQNGAHAGPGPNETGAFALLPRDTSLQTADKSFLRPAELRQTAERFLRRSQETRSHSATDGSPQAIHKHQVVAADLRSGADTLHVMTYNVHACIGMDGQLSPGRIARLIAQSRADIVALQELDIFRSRTGRRDQALEIARHLEMHYHFHPAWELEEEGYGDAVLSRFPLRVTRSGKLPDAHNGREPRGAIWVEISLPDAQIQFVNTHLSVYPRERYQQAEELMSSWIHSASRVGPTILCGDFNALPHAPTYQVFAKRLLDVQIANGRLIGCPTWFSPRPIARIDHIFTTPEFGVIRTDVMQSQLARVASDHLPVVAQLSLPRTLLRKDESYMEPIVAQ
jgi:endonuclease/exonuclease/phosphatase family metal-dependent hydrolase